MGLDLTTVSSVNPPVPYNGGLKLSWAGTLPVGSKWQIYSGGSLVKSTFENTAHIPAPSGTQQIAIGSVPVADAGTSFASSLPPLPKLRVTLSWQGGRAQDPVDGDVQGFRVYGQDTPGGPIDYTNPLYDVPVFIAGITTDGFGLGGFGSGGFGYTAGTYSWTSGTLTSGNWTWSVRTYDSAGNEGPDAFITETIKAPPTEPPIFTSDGTRLHYLLLGFGQVGFGIDGYGEPEIELEWNASTG